MFNQKRLIGIEMEGYVHTYPEDISVPFSDIGQDGSLDNNEWDDNDEPYGVEIRTVPLQNAASAIPFILSTMYKHGWEVNSCAGTHIHIDISDYNEQDKAKLLRFGKGIERIIFSLVEDYRYFSNNDYCRAIHEGWRKVFWPNSKFNKLVNWSVMNDIQDFLEYNSLDGLWNGKYQWMNVLGSNYSTVEFRLFHAVRSEAQLIQQANLAHNIVEYVKNATPEQIEFVIKHLYNSNTADEVLGKFFEAIDMEPMNVIGDKAWRKLVKKIDEQQNVQVEVAV